MTSRSIKLCQPSPSHRFTTCRGLLHDSAGSSLLIALVFFLICAIIGSIVMTAASVTSQTTATYRDTQQADYAVTSATRGLGSLAAGSQVVWSYPSGSTKPDFANQASYENCADILEHLWKTYGDAIWAARTDGLSYEVPEIFTLSVPDMQDVYARFIFDRDCTIEIHLSLDMNHAKSSAYNETTRLQAEPHFDGSGKLLAITWKDPLITKTAELVGGGQS